MVRLFLFLFLSHAVSVPRMLYYRAPTHAAVKFSISKLYRDIIDRVKVTTAIHRCCTLEPYWVRKLIGKDWIRCPATPPPHMGTS